MQIVCRNQIFETGCNCTALVIRAVVRITPKITEFCFGGIRHRPQHILALSTHEVLVTMGGMTAFLRYVSRCHSMISVSFPRNIDKPSAFQPFERRFTLFLNENFIRANSTRVSEVKSSRKVGLDSMKRCRNFV